MAQEQGRVVRVELNSADLTTAAELGLYDENGEPVTLQPHERLVLYQVLITMANATGGVTIFDDADGGNDVDDGERLLRVQTNTVGEAAANQDHHFGPEGLASSIGTVPHAIADAAGAVTIVGTAYIMNGKTESHRPSWRANDFGQ